ncbi:uncharacterized protein CcaverHIS019_0301650 [Cutaneotrichosporon cavernicola]|uniref:protein-histidine N-methyltransferase n=1 Tax=Cutaneotrichosporon cavernicola TaxID=279322 RepID=A0AA48L1R8_9TREE|nr:uncharacterized protein CcaverHIS019_0301650 [Cutaneotrichosporon cavernicola]BEI90095.1 hypothetical protein CcaverHIS019_0301650 [Cutaneotrichosporon cavernicola]BEI97873.1 hypothetical protein CcaverHIS631_0301720 [Cutaneotrichosporon cavernicola]BEJ05651.1 hypothetical protein CcaverHIS641_0301730 [Cutaneotrichosporon cavernicola]
MFKFSFVDESDDEDVQVVATSAAHSREPGPSQDHTLADLIKTLPDVISYSPLPHPSGGAPLLRRDLYDARFQLAVRGGEEGGQDEDAYVDADTDLIPGTYEGGLKSWEGGVDLVEVISAATKGNEADWVRDSKVLELGCGTGLPSAYLLRCLLSSSLPPGKTVIHVQDYNLPVLSLVTLPNLVLAALPSLPLSARGAAEAAALPRPPKSDTIEEEPENEEDWQDQDEDEDIKRPFDPNAAGTLELSPAVLDAFTSLLEERGVELKFTSGDWGGMAQSVGSYDLIMSAETIYAEDSVGPLLDVIRAASASSKKENGKENDLSDSLGALQIDDFTRAPLSEGSSVILIAAKVLYFGVGGGLDAFLGQVEGLGGWSVRVRDWVRGVGRAVVRIGW